MPHDKFGREVVVGDWVRWQPSWSPESRVGVVYDITPGAESCNVRAVALRLSDVAVAPELAAALTLPATMTGLANVAVVQDGGYLTAAELELVTKGDGTPIAGAILRAFLPGILREFAGYLTAALPELHGVEVPRVAALVDAFLALPNIPGLDAPVAPEPSQG